MIEEERPVKMRSFKRRVEENAAEVEKIVEAIVTKYNQEMTDLMSQVKDRLERRDTLTDDEIERIVLKLPVFMYFAAGGVETLGIESDTSKAAKKEVFNDAFIRARGTINDKTASAELDTFSEQLVEDAFSRAYKKLKLQLDMAQHVFSGAKKVLSKRMTEREIAHRENPNYRPRRNEEDD